MGDELKARKYRVVATRTTEYEVFADDEQHAIDEMIEGNGTETGGNTEHIEAVAICPTCDSELSDRTTRIVEVDDEEREECTYCDTCDREV